MKFTHIPKELSFAVQEAARLLELELRPALSDVTVTFKKDEGMSLTKNSNTVTIGYDRVVDATRALSFLERFVADGTPVFQKAKYDTLCTMADCSRNAVLNIDSVKNLIVHLALMGYNSLMLYTEDTYEIPEYPYFGHLRGRYTVDELKELDEYGAKMGVELIPCIQTLAHLNAIVDWDCFRPFIDIDDILLADDERTYQLIEAMFKTLRSCFRTKKIHIGMDEAGRLGRGKHTDVYGYEEKADILLRHLSKVVDLCNQYEFEPIMWSDMFFRALFNGKYDIGEGSLPKEVTEKIPEEVALCYWDYYTNPSNSKKLDTMFRVHSQTEREVWFAGGAWTWSGYCPKNHFSLWVTPNQLAYAEKYGVKNVIATCWGDDGGECTIFNILPTLLMYAECAYDTPDLAVLEKRSMDCFGISFTDFMKIDATGQSGVLDDSYTHPISFAKVSLYNDALFGMMDWDIAQGALEEKYAKDAALLEQIPDNRFSFLFDTQRKLALVLEKKYRLSADIKAAYRDGNTEVLQSIVDNDLPEIITRLDDFIEAFRFQWHWFNKPFGYELQDVRLGGLKMRLITASKRLQDYLNGVVDRLEELEQPDLPTHSTGKVNEHTTTWRRIFTRGPITMN